MLKVRMFRVRQPGWRRCRITCFGDAVRPETVQAVAPSGSRRSAQSQRGMLMWRPLRSGLFCVPAVFLLFGNSGSELPANFAVGLPPVGQPVAVAISPPAPQLAPGPELDARQVALAEPPSRDSAGQPADTAASDMSPAVHMRTLQTSLKAASRPGIATQSRGTAPGSAAATQRADASDFDSVGAPSAKWRLASGWARRGRPDGYPTGRSATNIPALASIPWLDVSARWSATGRAGSNAATLHAALADDGTASPAPGAPTSAVWLCR
jgi:hypothetical protein